MGTSRSVATADDGVQFVDTLGLMDEPNYRERAAMARRKRAIAKRRSKPCSNTQRASTSPSAFGTWSTRSPGFAAGLARLQDDARLRRHCPR
jgi:hypothetical protein